MHRAGEIPPSTSSGSNGPVKLEAMRFTQALERVLCTKYAPGQLLTALPIGLSEGCVLLRDISKDDVISFNDVEAFPPSQVEALWREQNARWPASAARTAA